MTNMVPEIQALARSIDSRRTNTVASAVAEILVGLGISHAFGIIGGACAPLVHALQQAGVVLVHARHEAGAVFQATEAYMATGQPAACFTTAGPGLTNALTGVAAARWDQAKLVLVSGITSPALRGRGAIQETSPYTLPYELLFAPGRLFHFAAQLADPAELDEIQLRLRAGLLGLGGFVAHLSLPLALQSTPIARPPRSLPGFCVTPPSCPAAAVEQVAKLLADERFVIWIGAGAQRAAPQLRELAERTGAPVICSPRGKGIFPERHPQFIGVTGSGGHSSTLAYMREHRPRHVLVLGTRMSEVSSAFDEVFVPSASFIHVDIDRAAFGAAYPRANTLAIESDCGSFLARLLPQLAARPGPASPAPIRASKPPAPAPALELRREGPVRPQALMAAIQAVIVDDSDALIMTESGNSFAWGNHLLRFAEPGRYRTSSAWGSMGHMVAGVVGAAAMTQRKVVAIVGDAAMMMNNEINTAVQINAPAVWIVLNDAKLGIVAQALEAWDMAAIDTSLPRVDFVEFARSMGADGARARSEVELDAVLRRAMAATGPFVVDVDIDAREISPVVSQRVESLRRQARRGAASLDP